MIFGWENRNKFMGADVNQVLFPNKGTLQNTVNGILPSLLCYIACNISLPAASPGLEEANSSWLGQYSHYVEVMGSKCGTAMIVATN